MIKFVGPWFEPVLNLNLTILNHSGGSSPKFNQVAEPEPWSGPEFKKLSPKTGRNRTTAPLLHPHLRLGAQIQSKIPYLEGPYVSNFLIRKFDLNLLHRQNPSFMVEFYKDFIRPIKPKIL
jgi:hypothetical protein